VVIPVYDSNPTRRRPYVTWALLLINVLAFLLSPVARGPLIGQASIGELWEQQGYFLEYGAVPEELTSNRPLDYTVGEAAGRNQCFREAPDYRKRPWLSSLTSIFVHGGWLHLLGNMLFLWVFGNNVEDRFGRLRFLLFYLAVGVVSTYAFALTRPGAEEPLVGASGAISGVLGAYLLLYPHARVLVAIPLGIILHTMRIPAGLVLVLWFGLQLLSNAMTPAGEGGVAFRAHIGGFVAGMLLIPIFKQRRFRLRLPWG